MDAGYILLFILLGVIAGILSGLIGIGGGVIIVPALVFLFGFTQHQAQGTTLALLVPPIGILAAWSYYRRGDVNIEAAVLIVIGFLLGSLFGARIAAGLSDVVLKKIFGVCLLLIAIRMIFFR
ncbi:MAG: sulfite exporter TauE/SafE family protein [Syntrophorhabdaceae bacterium]|nr:sulfite exporter TauE/SafE family protein [Syntrophorhabdaceae bacterium]MDD4195778.1 sulfite exporter TauE/SafE family protein [Syntrophorhabdaceae bacterium]HOC45394.1 sulfite exporter TauE/SafE family protein [Syntrophorhabdaceae bacterium]